MVKKAIKLSVLLVVMIAAGAVANPVGWGFSVYADANGYDGRIADDTSGLLTLYVFPWGPPATAVQFSATKPDCFQGVYVGEHSPFSVVIGNSQTGVSIAYGTCMSTPSYVLAINYFIQGLTPDCCWYPLDKDIADPHGISGQITFTDCSSPPVIDHVKAGASTINWVIGCDTPVEPTTWGKVKSLYAR